MANTSTGYYYYTDWGSSTSTSISYTYSTTATAGTSNNVWYSWVSNTTSNETVGVQMQSTVNDYIWTTWVESTGTNTGSGTITVAPENAEQQQTREQMAAQYRRQQEALQERYAKEAAEREAARQLAEQKAFALLKLALSDADITTLETEQHFTVRGSNGKTLYRIRKGRTQNVDELDEKGRVKRRLCFHPTIACPDFDTMLSQKLLLETNEDEALRIANFS